MLRALTIEEVFLVSGGMEEYADTESLDGGGSDFDGGGGDFGYTGEYYTPETQGPTPENQAPQPGDIVVTAPSGGGGVDWEGGMFAGASGIVVGKEMGEVAAFGITQAAEAGLIGAEVGAAAGPIGVVVGVGVGVAAAAVAYEYRSTIRNGLSNLL